MQKENHEILTALQYKPQWKKGKKYKTRGYNGTQYVFRYKTKTVK